MSLVQLETAFRGGEAKAAFKDYRQQQARISRRRLYPLTVFYTLYSVALLILLLRSAHPWVGLGFYLAGVPIWTLVEYLFHRYVLHGRFAPGKWLIQRFLHERLDPLHWDHHERPLDGMHISGELRDLLPLFAVAAPASFLFPIYALPAMLAGVVQSYVIEEWVHHSTHFYSFRNPYFKYIKRHHLNHHTRHGIKSGYGLTSGFWDLVFDTRFPENVPRALSRRRSG